MYNDGIDIGVAVGVVSEGLIAHILFEGDLGSKIELIKYLGELPCDISLIDVSDPKVRCAIVDIGYNVCHYIDDESADVRALVASKGIGLGILINDPDPKVRRAVAYQDHGLDTLKDDPDETVRNVVSLMYIQRMKKEMMFVNEMISKLNERRGN
jgi:hypothetical protein